MEKIFIPMIALCDIPESIPSMGIESKKGDIFLFDPDNQIHQVLKDNHAIDDIPNDECDFYCEYQPRLDIGNQEYEYGDLINTNNINDTVLTNLTYIGYIRKVLKEKDNSNNENKTKNVTKKKVEYTYSKLAKELNVATKDFKAQILENLGYKINMKDKVPVVKLRKIKSFYKKQQADKDKK